MNLPNTLAFGRLLLAPVVPLMVVSFDQPAMRIVTLLLFIVAVLSDIADGMIARRFNLITRLGIFLDPLADKLLINLTLLSLAAAGAVPFWLALAHCFRDFISSEFKSFAAIQHVHIAIAPLEGKLKALLQCLGTIAAMALLVARAGALPTAWVSPLSTLSLTLLLLALSVGLVGMSKLFYRHGRLLLTPSPETRG